MLFNGIAHCVVSEAMVTALQSISGPLHRKDFAGCYLGPASLLTFIHAEFPEPELDARDAYEWTNGKVVFADRVRRSSSAAEVSTSDGRSFMPGISQQCTQSFEEAVHLRSIQ